MALQFNNYAKQTAILGSQVNVFSGGTLRIYPTTVALPTGLPVAAPASPILMWSSMNFTRTGNLIKLNMTPAQTYATAAASGTAGWWHFTSSSSPEGSPIYIYSDSIGLVGTGAVVGLNSLTLTSGTAYQLDFALNII